MGKITLEKDKLSKSHSLAYLMRNNTNILVVYKYTGLEVSLNEKLNILIVPSNPDLVGNLKFQIHVSYSCWDLL